jgi:exosortase/archaeosortase family protein
VTTRIPALLRSPNTAIALALAITAVMLIPFIATVNDFLANIAQLLGANTLLLQTLAPLESQLVGATFRALSPARAVSMGPFLTITLGQHPTSVYIDWNCTGWQSWLILTITLLVGLHGSYTRRSKLATAAAAMAGTFVVNIARITTVILVAIYIGTEQALLYHTYGGIVTLGAWLIVFWLIAYRYLLRKPEPKAGVSGR